MRKLIEIYQKKGGKMNKSITVERVSDYEVNTDAGDIIKDTNKMEWIEVGGGSRFKVLRACKKTGDWALYVQMDPGAKFQAHRHQGCGEFFITKGELLYDVGSTPAGTYGYEPVFAEHFIAGTEVLTEMYFSGRGSVTYFDEEKNIDWILDSEWLHKLNLGEVELDVSPKS